MFHSLQIRRACPKNHGDAYLRGALSLFCAHSAALLSCPSFLARHFRPRPYLACAILGKDCTVDTGAIIEDRVEIGANCHIGAGAVIHAGVVIGDGSRIGANSTLSHCLIGKRVIIHRGVHIGQDGFGFALGAQGHVKVPQLGRVLVEDDVEIGSGTCIDRGTGPDTVIGYGSKIDNLVQIGHNVHIGKHSILWRRWALLAARASVTASCWAARWVSPVT